VFVKINRHSTKRHMVLGGFNKDHLVLCG